MFVPHQLLFSYLPYIRQYKHGPELPHVAGTLPPMTDLLLNSANLSPSPPRCVGGIEGGGGGLAEPFRGRSAEAVPCWLSSLVGSAPFFTSGHYIVVVHRLFVN
jgi:hypothetical protein